MDSRFGTLASITCWTALRAACVAVLTVFPAAACARSLRPLRASVSGGVLWLMFVALLMPPMLLGYHVASTRAAATVWSAELLYSALVLIRVAPLAMVLLWMRPSAKTDESSHTFSMMVRIPFRDRAIWKLRGWWREMGGIFCVAFIVAFQEFDLAACMNARSWTIALFDAQSGGLALGDSLRMMLWPFAVECVALGGIWLHSHSGQPRQTRDLPQRSVQPVILPLAVCIALIAIPLSAPLLFLRGGWSGLMSLENFALIREVANSFLLALVAATGAWLLAGWALQNRTRTMLLALPGLLGGLIVSLGLLTLFQLPPLHLLRASPLPVLVALVLQILPAALFLRWILNQGQQSEAAHIARENGSGALIWTILRRPALWGGGLLFLQAYGDFTANSLLAPPALTSAFSRIFNLLHYGQTAVLSAMLLITLAVPVVALFIATLVVRLHAIRRTA